jgi:hypothetical protein
VYNETDYIELSKSFIVIFDSLSKKNFDDFDKLTSKEAQSVYVKICDCFYVIAENASKNKFQNSISYVLKTALLMLQNNGEIVGCLETFFVNGFCRILENGPKDIEKILTSIAVSCSNLEGNDKIMSLTYPYLNQLLRLFIEFSVNDSNGFNVGIQQACLDFMLYLSSKKTEQQIKCENCKVKSGLHDTLRLLFLIKHTPIYCIANNIDLKTLLPTYYKLVTTQHKILYELKRLGCANHEKCFRKLQTDIHNTAISLNKANYYDYSLKLFNVYIELELRYFKDANELKNVSRALYNKSICELGSMLYNDAIQDAFLSLVFSLPDGVNSEKYMSLVMDIKAKSLKQESANDELQMLSILEVCKKTLEDKKYGNLKPFFINLKFR